MKTIKGLGDLIGKGLWKGGHLENIRREKRIQNECKGNLFVTKTTRRQAITACQLRLRPLLTEELLVLSSVHTKIYLLKIVYVDVFGVGRSLG